MTSDPGYDPSQALASARSLATLTWAWLAVGGVVTIALGLIGLFAPGITVSLLAVLFSLWLIVAGVVRVTLAAGVSSWPSWQRWLVGPLGGLMIVVGLAGLVNVAGSERLLAAFIGIGFLVAAGVDLMLAATGPRGRSRAATVGLGVVHLCLAVVFLLLPQLGLTAIAVLIGLVLLMLGTALLAAAFTLRRTARRLLAEAEAAAGRGPDDGPRVIEGEVL